MRKEVYVLLVAGFLVWIQFGCQPVDFPQQGSNPGSTKVANQSHSQASTEDGSRTILMGSFNIQDFGVTKIGKNDVTRVLVDIVRRFDILAIQELSSVQQHIIPNFVEMLNANGMNYSYIVGPRQGYTTQTEQYVYIFDAEKFEVVGQPFVAEDPGDLLSRSPFVTSFRCTETSADRAFTFTLLNLHTSPKRKDNKRELAALQRIVQNVVAQVTYDDDFIVLGDFNAPPYLFSQYPMLANQVSIVPDELVTNTRGDKNIDNIVFDARATTEYQGRFGVFDFMSEYNLALGDALSVSDHLPVWAEFSIYETPSAAVASQPTTRR